MLKKKSSFITDNITVSCKTNNPQNVTFTLTNSMNQPKSETLVIPVIYGM